MKVVFRVDASISIGTGHVMRCRTLATALKKHGADIQFITRAHPGHLGDMLTCDGFSVTLLPQPACLENKGNDYAAWLGVKQQEDAEQTIAALENQQCDWLIVDHYGLDRVWEAQLQSHTSKLMVIDDLANRPHECDMLLDQNYAVAGQERYQAWVPAHCQLLLGPRHALLRPEYAQYSETIEPRTGHIKRVLVFMGGADNANITGKVLSALSTVQLAHLEVEVVISPSFNYKAEVTEQASARPNTHIHGPLTHLADLMEKADLAVGAGGGTTWERLCMGLPSLVLSIAENQVPACEALASSGLIRYLGDAHKLDVAAIESALLEVLAEAGQLHLMATSYKALVDGRGAHRVAEAMNPTPTASLKIRPANAKDALTYFAWVNDPEVRSNAIHSEPVDMTTHLKWFDRRLSDLNTHLYVLEAGDLPIGQVRFELHGDEATIDYSLDVLVRGRGWASQLLKLGIEALNSSRPTILNATVKPENAVSAATFIHLGFLEQEVDKVNGNRHFQLSSLVLQKEESQKRMGVSNG
jgi:UDP-2,4-diacetamido-2,4,6-trideoxy-beta-L-altropyranose hydrolase